MMEREILIDLQGDDLQRIKSAFIHIHEFYLKDLIVCMVSCMNGYGTQAALMLTAATQELAISAKRKKYDLSKISDLREWLWKESFKQGSIQCDSIWEDMLSKVSAHLLIKFPGSDKIALQVPREKLKCTLEKIAGNFIRIRNLHETLQCECEGELNRYFMNSN